MNDVSGPPTPVWLCVLLAPFVPLIALVAWLPFTVPIMLPVGYVWDRLGKRKS